MELLLSSIAVAIATVALKKAIEPKTLEVRYVRTRPVNPPLPPLPEATKPALPYFLNQVAGGYNHVN